MKQGLFGILLVASFSAHAASFDCTQASNQTEKIICNTPSLSQADDDLYKDYLQAKWAANNSAGFQYLTKSNLKLREKCITVACLANWYINSKKYNQMYLPIQYLPAGNGNSHNKGDDISLDGTLISMTYAGAPNYESIEDGDTAETYFVLRPDNPIQFPTDAPQFGSTKLMQLSVKTDDYKKYRDLVGEKVTVGGTLLYAETGHHHTPLMIDAGLIKATTSKVPAPIIQRTLTSNTNQNSLDEPYNAGIPPDNGSIMPVNLISANQIRDHLDSRYTTKMMNCTMMEEMSEDGCIAYWAVGIAKAYSDAGYNFRASIIDAAQDQAISYARINEYNLVSPFIVVLKTDDGTDFMVKHGVIQASDIPYLRESFAAFTEE